MVSYFIEQDSTIVLEASTDGTSFYRSSTDGSVIGYASESTLSTDSSAIGVATPIVDIGDTAVTFDAVSFGFGVVAGLILVLVFILIRLGCQKLAAKPRVEYSRIRP